MSVADAFMLVIAVLGGSAALLVVTSRNVVHAALYLVIALLAVAGTFLLLGAEFLAWAQVLVYVGAVVVLILFGLMLTRAPIGPMAQSNELGKALPVGVSGALFLVLVVLILRSFGNTTFTPRVVTAANLGELLYVDWAFPFMVLGFLLTVSLIGAVVIARQDEGEGPEPGLDFDTEQLPEVPSETDATPSPHVQHTAEVPAGREGGGA
ncbi:MAG: NADH-quinone oxidoreductase subunit J family protein [Egibacteraceae bacterium]